MNPADQALTEAAARRALLDEQWSKAVRTTKKKRDEFTTAVAELAGLAEDRADAIAAHKTALAAARR